MQTDTMRTARPGVLAGADLAAALADGALVAAQGLTPDQVQPASVDLRLGARAYRVRAAFLPGEGRSVRARLAGGMTLHEIDLTAGAVLERGCVYVVELQEQAALPAAIDARANPKSSTGRIDVFVRLVTDGGVDYDRVPAGYVGPLYAEISPRTFSILVRAGSSLNQLRLRRGAAPIDDDALASLHLHVPLTAGAARMGGGLRLSVDLSAGLGPVIGYRARRHAALIDVDAIGALSPDEYWEPISRPARGFIILDPEEFYILASLEVLRIPVDLAAEMVPIDADLGAFRVHYAGFFDPGFGLDAPSRAVLEVRGYDAPFVLEHGQTVGRLAFERLTAPAARAYGAQLASHYQGQGLRLSKHFVAA